MYSTVTEKLDAAIENYRASVYLKVENVIVIFLAAINDPNKLSAGTEFDVEDNNIRNTITESSFAFEAAKSIFKSVHMDVKYDSFNNKVTVTRTKDRTVSEYTVDATTVAGDYILGKLITKITPDIEKDGHVTISFETNAGFATWFTNPVYKPIMDTLIKTTNLKAGVTDKDVTFYVDGKFSSITGYSKGI